ncbi:MAG: hypothetical protein R3E79_42875 [Caldilineaceae bacterium]
MTHSKPAIPAQQRPLTGSVEAVETYDINPPTMLVNYTAIIA